MKSQITKIGFCSALVFCVALTATFTACGDEITNEIMEQTDVGVLAKGEKQPECGKDNAGEMLYVSDSAAVFYCADGHWTTLKGEDGKSGTSIEGKMGNSCSAVQDEKTKNVKITCETDDGKGVTYTIQNGADGHSCSATQNDAKTETIITCQGADGKNVSYVVKNGESCSTIKNEDGSYTIQCAGSEDVTIRDGKSAYELDETDLTLDEWLVSLEGDPGERCWAWPYEDENRKFLGYDFYCGKNKIGTIYNGTNGTPGENCKIDESKGNGIVEVTCGEKTVTLYKSMCGSSSYDPKEKACYEGELYELGSSIYDERRQKLIDLRDNHEYDVLVMDINENKIQYRETWTAQNISYNKKDSSWCGGGRYTSVGDCFKYGRLYMWEAAKTACPKGWHLPSRDEWNALIEAVGGAKVAGVNLKSTSYGGKDLYGFTALTAGIVGDDGDFGTSFNSAWFWSSTGDYFEDVRDGVAKTVVVNAYCFHSVWDNMEEVTMHKALAQSVRCILDKDSK